MEVSHAEETSELAFSARLWKGRYCFDFGLVRPATLDINQMSEKANFSEFTTSSCSSSRRKKYVFQVLDVLFFGPAGDEDFIGIGISEVQATKGRRWSVGRLERHPVGRMAF